MVQAVWRLTLMHSSLRHYYLLSFFVFVLIMRSPDTLLGKSCDYLLCVVEVLILPAEI